MRKKILLVIPTLDRCGAEKQLTLLATGLPKDRFDVRVAVLTRSGPYYQTLLDDGIRVDVIGKRRKLSIAAYLKLKKLIKEFKPDVVHTWLFAANAYGRRAAFACRVPVVICGERCVDPWKGAVHAYVDRALEPKTTLFAVNSQGIVDFYVERGAPREKFVVIPNGVESTPTFTEAQRQERKFEILDELGVPRIGSFPPCDSKSKLFEEMAISDVARDPEIPYLIGLVARLWPQKRVRDALWAADQMKFARMNFYLLVIGDGPERDALLRYRDDLRLQDRVFFLGERDDVKRFMPAFDLLWNCSEYEGQSNAILEALAVGTPVIASNIPGNAELVRPGENGLLISEFDGDKTRRLTAFSRETMRALNPDNNLRRRQWGENAVRIIRDDFSVQKMIERYAELYENALNRQTIR